MARNPNYPEFNKHHILFNRFLWDSSPELNRLRTTKELITPLRIDPHRRLHRAIEQVVVPDRHMVRRINKEFSPVRNDTVGTIGNLIISTEIAMGSTYASYVAIQTAKLMIDGLRLQLPFVMDQNEREA